MRPYNPLPKIVAIRRYDGPQSPVPPIVLAQMMVICGTVTIPECQLCRGTDGKPFVRGPKIRSTSSTRIHFQPSPERDALLAEALRRYRELSDS